MMRSTVYANKPIHVLLELTLNAKATRNPQVLAHVEVALLPLSGSQSPVVVIVLR
jgi:hypothetical protein